MDSHSLLKIAARLRDLADEIERTAAESDEGRTVRTASAMKQIAHQVAAGRPKDLAVLDAAAAHGLVHNLLGVRWQLSEFRAKAEQRRALYRDIANLTAAGLRDAEIARIVGLHPKSLPRIRRRMREAATEKPKQGQKGKG